VVIAADLTRPAIAVPPEATLAAAMARFEDPQLTELAVVDTLLQKHLRGRVNRQDVIASISDEVLGQQKRAHFRGADGRKQALPLPAGFELARIPVPDAWIGLVLDAVPPKELAGITPVLMVRRQPDGPEQLVPAGLELVLEAGTELMVIATAEALQRVRAVAAARSDVRSCWTGHSWLRYLLPTTPSAASDIRAPSALPAADQHQRLVKKCRPTRLGRFGSAAGTSPCGRCPTGGDRVEAHPQ